VPLSVLGGINMLALGAGDVNGDGRMDLVVAADALGIAFDGVLNIFHGNGDGGVSGPTAIGVGVNPVDVLVMDLNLDGLADITVVHEAERAPVIDGAVSVLLATLGGGFIRVLDVATTAEPRAMAPGDFDGDGLVDLAVARENAVDVFQGSGGAFALAATIPLPADPRDVTVSDFNGDGIADIVATTAGGLETILRTGAPGFLFSPPVHSDPNPEPHGVASGDWNADGRADLVVANGGPANTATVLVNNCASLVVINTNDSGPGSLRQALLNANASAFAPTVAFGIPGPGPHTIVPLSALPPITRPMQINGTTQPGFSGVPLIVLNGASAGAVSGFRIEAGNTVVRGLTINGFSGAGVDIFGAGGNLIQGNYIGLNAAGTAAVSNGTGVSLTSSVNNLIGGATAAERNVISGNLADGVISTGGIDFDGNEISGNYIGTNAAGTGAVGNGLRGVTMVTPGRIGAVGRGNLISGNGSAGIQVLQDDHDNIIEANRVGTNAAGTAAIPNGGPGVAINDTEFSRIGGTAAGAGNLISGNLGAGIQLAGDASGTVVQGNLIGTNAAGTAALANGGGGVVISGTFGTMLGGTTAAARNLISGNQGHGVFLSDSRTNNILGNWIGVNATGNIALPNAADGVHLATASDTNTIGTLDGTGRNVISGNGGNGIWILEGSSNTVFGNYIGTNAAASGAVANGQAGIALSTGPNTVGGPGTAGNLISGNTGAGISLLPGGNGNVVRGNFIGTNATGVGRIPNAEGIRIEGAAATAVGGPAAGEANLISGNGTGILIVAGGNNNVLQNNLIGTNAAGTGPLSNNIGVSIDGIENDILNGIIAFNAGAGVVVGSGIGNHIAASIHTNGGLGIDLGGDGVTPNDAADLDVGPNSLQNFPVIATAVAVGGGTNVTGTAFGTDTGTVRLRFYASAGCDASGNGEGARLLGEQSVLLDISGAAPFAFTVGPSAPGEVITATATDLNASTSEFSACTIVVGG
jgi:hypothetical protein